MSANKKIIQETPIFILAGGLGTRLSEETQLKPKPMVEIGNIPILLHIMRWYYSFGFNDFVICAGYRSWEIKKFFLDYENQHNHIEIDHRELLSKPAVLMGKSKDQEKWRVRVVDTGADAMTGARIARAFDVVSEHQQISNFAVTYGDGLSNVCLTKELDFHLSHKKIGTVLGVIPDARFGELVTNEKSEVEEFVEKPRFKQSRINGGFFFFKNEFRKYISTSPDCILEKKPLENLAKDKELSMWKHDDFWQPMDTLRDKILLEEMWLSQKAPWKVLPTEEKIT